MKIIITHIILIVFSLQTFTYSFEINKTCLASTSNLKFKSENTDKIIHELRHIITSTIKNKRAKNLAREFLYALDVEIKDLNRKEIVYNIINYKLKKVQNITKFLNGHYTNDSKALIFLLQQMLIENIKNPKLKLFTYTLHYLRYINKQKGFNFLLYFSFVESLGYVLGPLAALVLLGEVAAALLATLPWHYSLFILFSKYVRFINKIKYKLFPSKKLKDEKLMSDFDYQLSFLKQFEQKTKKAASSLKILDFLLNYYDKHPYLSDIEKKHLLSHFLTQMELIPAPENFVSKNRTEIAA